MPQRPPCALRDQLEILHKLAELGHAADVWAVRAAATCVESNCREARKQLGGHAWEIRGILERFGESPAGVRLIETDTLLPNGCPSMLVDARLRTRRVDFPDGSAEQLPAGRTYLLMNRRAWRDWGAARSARSICCSEIFSPLTQEADDWLPDGDRPKCAGCRKTFGLTRRRHHCRACGEIFCDPCAPHTPKMTPGGKELRLRLCLLCNGRFSFVQGGE
eukprot:TRINITY_DN7444_c0_g1_i1.p1 TRINITY_DN7444_c0_g1~~TRINITY_DN7444_c0_g1_i1.p1  ORF type:complete len:248 (+),score=63.39 TRINITY_DN7444_c0_g1_i1:88-744(+)